MLIASPKPVICAIMSYHRDKSKNIDNFTEDPLRRDQFSIRKNIEFYSGYRFSADHEVIKYEMEVSVKEMDCYVAPTFINLENPTFWINQGSLFEQEVKPEEK
jgi:hypothetical protein